MNINKETDGSKLTVSIEGRLDTTTAPEFEAAMKADIDKVNELVIDLAPLEYISSAGLRVLLSLHKCMSSKGGMKVAGANENVMEIFEVTGFSDILELV